MPILIVFVLCFFGAWWLEGHCRWLYEVLVWAGGIGFVAVVARDTVRLLWAIIRVPFGLVCSIATTSHRSKPATADVSSRANVPHSLTPPKHPEWN